MGAAGHCPSVIATAKPQSVVAEVFEVVVGAAGFVAGHAAEAALDRLPLETGTGCLDLDDDVTSGELAHASALLKSVDGVKHDVSTARAAVGELGL